MPHDQTRTSAVMEAVRARIAARAYPPGTRLPSLRAQAKTMGVSVSTVVEAYERLAADNTISARRGAGFYVCGPAAPLSLAEIGPRLDRAIDPLWISRQSLENGESTLKPGCGWLPASWMYEAGMRRALRSVARDEASSLADYATPLGLPLLRQWLARRLADIGVSAPPEHIMLTESGTQAIDLICRFLLEPGDTVLVDDPCYFNFHALLRAHRVKAVGVRRTPEGPDLAAFASALATHAPRLYITNAGIHNPTGGSLAPAVAHRLLTLADGAGLVIVEDDIFADFETRPVPRLAAFDGLSRVIQIGSFSKTLSASLRCGYVAARPDWIDSLADLKLATGFVGGHLAPAVTLAALTGSGYRRHMAEVRLRLAKAMDHVMPRLAALGMQPWIVPQAGMFLWCRLPGDADAAQVARACLQDGVVLAPGQAFSPPAESGGTDWSGFLRFNVAQSLDERLYATLARALDR